MKRIKNVVAVDTIEASQLQGMSRSRLGLVSLPRNIVWTPIDIQVPAKLSIINKVQNKNTVWTSTLVFKTCEDISVIGHVCYRVKLANGQSLLIGSFDRPYPITSTSDVMPDNMSDNQLLEVTVTLSSRAKLPYIA